MHTLAGELITSIRTLYKTYTYLVGSLEPYSPNIWSSISALLEILSGVFCEISGLSNNDEGFLDELGLEPNSAEEAWQSLPLFLDICQKQLDPSQVQSSIVAIQLHIRCVTYSCLLATETSDGEDS